MDRYFDASDRTYHLFQCVSVGLDCTGASGDYYPAEPVHGRWSGTVAFGFNYLAIGGRRFFTGDCYHQLHHSFFNFNYGNTLAPLDAVFGSWHDGSKESLQQQKERKRQKRRAGC